MKKKFFVLAGVLIVAGLFTGCASTGMSAEEYYSQGQKADGKKYWDLAIIEYTRAIEKKTDYKEAYNSRGWAYLKKGDSARAEKDFLEVLRIDPSDYNVKVGLRHARAPHAAYLLFGEGTNAVNAGKFDLAVEKFNQAIALYPGYAGAYNNRGVAYLNKKMYDEADADYEKAVELDPEDANGYANLGNIYKKRGEYDKAEQYLNRALAIYPAYTYAKEQLEEVVAVNAEKAKKEEWDRRIAANPNLYPAPFNGQWKYVTPPRQVPEKTYTYTDYETKSERVTKDYAEINGWDGFNWTYAPSRPHTTYEPVTRAVTKTSTIPAYTIPELSTVWEFNGSTYRKTEMLFVEKKDIKASYINALVKEKKIEELKNIIDANGMIKRETKTGTFYYNGTQIELEDGTILRFVNRAISDGAGNRYTKQ